MSEVGSSVHVNVRYVTHVNEIIEARVLGIMPLSSLLLINSSLHITGQE